MMQARAFIISVAIFLLFFLGIPVNQLSPDLQTLFRMMPGDIGDARLNNYFLENVYQFLQGKSESLWHLGFFWPFPLVLGFSDNLFGSAPFYAIFRYLTDQPDTAFQLWFLFGYLVNFVAAYYALSKLGISRLSSCVGAAIFSFAIPVTAHAGHAQLHYRFGVPLAVLFFIRFLEIKNLRLLTLSASWLVWQFYCGVYVGFFAGLLIASIFAVYMFQNRTSFKTFLQFFSKEISESWSSGSTGVKWLLILTWFALLILLVLLFYPYLQVSRLYEAKRSWGEISIMLPRLQSYLIADRSWFWSSPDAKLFAAIPMRHEHQMFPGAIPMLLLFAAIIYGARTADVAARSFGLMVSALGLLVVLTLSVGGFSLWYLFHWLPLASAIRAMTRIDLVMLLPLGFAVAYFLDRLREKGNWGTRLIWVLILPALFLELHSTNLHSSQKSEWRQRLEVKLQQVPENTARDSVLFFSAPDNDGWWYKPELDAMWAAMKLGHKTMNGYSGNHPPGPGYGIQYGNDCSALPQRILAYIDFAERKLGQKPNYQELMSKVVPIGFQNCDPSWWSNPPQITWADRVYSSDEFSKLSFEAAKILELQGNKYLTFRLHNGGAITLSALSRVKRPIRLSWRYLDAACQPRTGWDTRKDIPFDIPAQGDLELTLPLDPASMTGSCGIEVSIVQEAVFWGHDVGVTPLHVRF